MAVHETDRFPAYARSLIGFIRAGGASVLVTSETTALGPEAEPIGGLSFLFNNVLLLRYIEMESETRRALSILKMRDSDHAKGVYPVRDRRARLPGDGQAGRAHGGARMERPAHPARQRATDDVAQRGCVGGAQEKAKARAGRPRARTTCDPRSPPRAPALWRARDRSPRRRRRSPPRVKRSNSFGASSSGTPSPSSATVTTTPSGPPRASSRMVLPP